VVIIPVEILGHRNLGHDDQRTPMMILQDHILVKIPKNAFKLFLSTTKIELGVT